MPSLAQRAEPLVFEPAPVTKQDVDWCQLNTVDMSSEFITPREEDQASKFLCVNRSFQRWT